MTVTPENDSAGVRDNNSDYMLSLLVWAAITRCLIYMSLVAEQRKRVKSLYS